MLEKLEQLQLPESSSIHPVFHVSLLKKKLGKGKTVIVDLPITQDQEIVVAPEKVLATRWVTRGDSKVFQGLIKWLNLSTKDSTWEDKSFIEAQFPAFSHFGDKNVLKRGVLLHIRERSIGIKRVEIRREKQLCCCNKLPAHSVYIK